MTYEIVKYGDPVLREPAARIAAVTEEIRTLAKDMLATMHAANGLGLAAEQVGRTESICVVDVPREMDEDKETGAPENPDVKMPLVLLNPEISEQSGRDVRDEGCLSFPEIYAKVQRAKEITVAYQDAAGAEHKTRVRGLLARAIQHEVDHLNGVLLADRVSPVAKVTLAGKFKRLSRQTRERLAARAAGDQ